MTTEADLPPLKGDNEEINRVRIGLIGTCKDVSKAKAILAEVRYKEWKKSNQKTKE